MDIVKIAGAFIEHLPQSRDDQVFVRALVDITRNFGMTTVAEWVGDEETIALLKEIGVEMLQGHRIGAPRLDFGGDAPVVAKAAV